MSPLVIAWSMCAAACLMLGLMHLLFWLSQRQVGAYLLAALMGLSAAVNGMLELSMLQTTSLELYNQLLRWENLVVFMILMPMVWFIHLYFQSGRRWLAFTITLLWSTGIIINFSTPGGSLTFTSLGELQRLGTFWGEEFSIPVGEINPWKLLADIASLLILLYTLDATLQLWRRDRRKRVLIVGGSITLFILAAGIHSPLVDAGVVAMPYMISFFFLAIVFALSYQVVVDAVKASANEQELQQTRRDLDQLARANLLGEYSTMLAHELNQPLAAILSNAQAGRRYLSAYGNEDADIHDIFEDIIRDDKRASSIITRLRSMLKNENIVRECFDLNTAIREITDLLESEIRSYKIQLSTRFSPDLPLVHAGRIEMQQVVLNLLVNAVREVSKVHDENRKIMVRTSINRNLVTIEIRDNGAGIPHALHDALFDNFVSGSKGGLGMGLAICHRIIEASGGRIWADNNEQGGACFSFTLPVDDEHCQQS